MKKFVLRISDGEIINNVITYSLEDAIEIFAITKNISIENLLKIFKVDEVK